MTPIDRQAAFSGTREIVGRLRIDVARLASYLSERLPGFAQPMTLRQFKGGQSNPTYLLGTPRRQYVLRRKPPGPLLPSAHAVDREFRVLRALHGEGFPVPEAFCYCDDASIIGTAFYVMDFVDGRVFWEPQMPASHPGERAAVYDAMNATIARLHAFDPTALGLEKFGHGEHYVRRQIERWSKQYRASEIEPIPAMEELIAWLPDHLPPLTPVRVVHGDFRLDNVIIANEGPDILAVLDWELATIGDPLADFTYHLMQWFMPRSDSGVGVGTLADNDLVALGIPTIATYVERYAERTGLDPRPHLNIYLAYNFFRLAAIFQGIAARARQGSAASEHAGAGSAIVRPLAERALMFAREAGS